MLFWFLLQKPRTQLKTFLLQVFQRPLLNHQFSVVFPECAVVLSTWSKQVKADAIFFLLQFNLQLNIVTIRWCCFKLLLLLIAHTQNYLWYWFKLAGLRLLTVSHNWRKQQHQSWGWRRLSTVYLCFYFWCREDLINWPEESDHVTEWRRHWKHSPVHHTHATSATTNTFHG